MAHPRPRQRTGQTQTPARCATRTCTPRSTTTRAYVEAHDNETAATLVKFWRRAQGWFWSNDMPIDEILTDNGPNFVSDAFAEVPAERRIMHRRTRPYRPQTNGKAERFNRTLADEFLYNFRFRSESERRIRLKRWIHESTATVTDTTPP